jgi:hypothetical protein
MSSARPDVVVPARFVGAWVRDGIAAGDEELAEPADVLWLQGRDWFADLRTARPDATAGPATTALGSTAEAFAGRCTWQAIDGVDPHEGGRLTWHHDVDWAGGFADNDGGDIHWISDRCFEERGTVDQLGASIGFREVWRAEPGDRTVLAAVAHPTAKSATNPAMPAAPGGEVTGILIAVGGERLILLDGRAGGGSFGYAHARRDASGAWQPVRRMVTPASTAAAELHAVEELAGRLAAHETVPPEGETFAGPSLTWTIVEGQGGVHGDVALSKSYRNTTSVRSST